MPERTITLSHKELHRLQMLHELEQRRITQQDASIQLGVSIRQIRRLMQRYHRLGEQGLQSRRRGQPSNNRLSEAVREAAIELLKAQYADFGPTLAQEKLLERHQLPLSVETVRQLMIQETLWRPKTRRRGRVHQRRERRACYGELIQIDGSAHDWFEGRAEPCTLLVFIDDATGRFQYLCFVAAETTQAYMEALRDYLGRYGRPAAIYSDKHSIFRINVEDPRTGSGKTQFGRALESLEIEGIHAHSPQAKGRVERANGTLQDRLVKEMRLQGIDSWEAGNAFLERFRVDFNRRFAVAPRQATDAHRGVHHSDEELALILCLQTIRTLSKNLELQYNNRVYQVQIPGRGYALRHSKITVCEAFDGSVTLLKGKRKLAYTLYEKGQRPKPPADEKTLNQRVDQARKKQASTPAQKPRPDHPWRKSFKTGKAAA